MAICQFPWQITAAANFIAQNGTPFNPYIQSPNRTRASLGTVNVQLQPNNSIRYDNYYQVDLHVDKAVRLGAARKITLNADLFNALNNNVVLAQVERQNTSTANTISTMLAPRVARFGVKVSFQKRGLGARSSGLRPPPFSCTIRLERRACPYDRRCLEVGQVRLQAALKGCAIRSPSHLTR